MCPYPTTGPRTSEGSEGWSFDLIEITVITEGRHGIAHGRVYGPTGLFCNSDGHLKGLEEEGDTVTGVPPRAVKVIKLRVRAKAAAGQVDGFDLFAQSDSAASRLVGNEHNDRGRRADASKGTLGHRRLQVRRAAVNVTSLPSDHGTGGRRGREGVGLVVVVVGAKVVGTVAGVELPPEVGAGVGMEWSALMWSGWMWRGSMSSATRRKGSVEVVAVPLVLAPEVAPGCSLATTTPINAVAPVAAITAERVKRRSRNSARRRVSGELRSLACLTGKVRPASGLGMWGRTLNAKITLHTVRSGPYASMTPDSKTSDTRSLPAGCFCRLNDGVVMLASP